MYTEGELRNNMGDSERVRDLQDKVTELKAEVSKSVNFIRLISFGKIKKIRQKVYFVLRRRNLKK